MTSHTGEEEQILTPFWGFVVKYGIGVVIAIFYVTAALHFSYTPDDTYIYLQYAKNLAHGAGFSFNTGMPSYGVTGPLWTLLVAAGAAAGLDPFIVAKTLDLIFAGTAILVLYLLAYLVLRDKIYAFFAAWIFSFDAWFLRWAGSGMESSLAVLLSLLAVYYAYQNEYIVAALVAGFLTLVRPEGLLLFGVLTADNMLNTTDRPRAARMAAVSIAVFLGVLIPWIIYSLFQFGTVVPNTLQAKMSGGLSVSAMWFVLTSSLKVLGATQAIPALLVITGLALSLSKNSRSLLRTELFPLYWGAALVSSYVIMEVQVVSRYLLLTTPIIVLYGLWGIKRLELVRRLSSKQVVLTLSIVTAFSLIQNQYIYRTHIVPHLEQFELGMEDCLKPIAYWLRAHTPEGTTVLTPDVGLLGYISDRRFYDTAGLVSPEVKRAFEGAWYAEGMKEKLYEKVVYPDYIVDRWAEAERLSSASLRPVMTRVFPSLSLTKPDPVFYTLYKTIQ